MLTLKSPAKINLFLKIISKRPDGFHELASLFQTIDFSDQLEIKLSPNDHFTCSDPRIPHKDNLALKALKLFREASHLSFSITCHLTKIIPLQAGLGGGSSNAATMLKGLNTLLDNPLSNDKLHSIASQLGSDVPFFLEGGTALCEGRGEIITSLPNLPRKSLWIVKPSIGISTPEVYKKLDLSKAEFKNIPAIISGHQKGEGEFFNDLEAPAFLIEPSVKQLKDQLLDQGFFPVLLSGSGASLFCFGDHTPKVPANTFVKRTQYI